MNFYFITLGISDILMRENDKDYSNIFAPIERRSTMRCARTFGPAAGANPVQAHFACL